MKKSFLGLGAALVGLVALLASCDPGSAVAQYYKVNFSTPGDDPYRLMVSVEDPVVKAKDVPVLRLNEWDFLGWYDDAGAEFKAGYELTEDITVTAKWRVLPEEITVTAADAGRKLSIEMRAGGYNAPTQIVGVYKQEDGGEWAKEEGYEASADEIFFTTPAAGHVVKYYVEFKNIRDDEPYKSNEMTVKTVSNSKIGKIALKDGSLIELSQYIANRSNVVGMVASVDAEGEADLIVSLDAYDLIAYSTENEEGNVAVGYSTDFTKTTPRTTLNDGLLNTSVIKNVSDYDEAGRYPLLKRLDLFNKEHVGIDSEKACWYLPSRDELLQVMSNALLINQQVLAIRKLATAVSADGTVITENAYESIISSTTDGTSIFCDKLYHGKSDWGLKDDQEYTLRPVTKLNW